MSRHDVARPRTLAFAAVLAILSVSTCRADDGGVWFVNPGVKISYTFGSGTGFTMGVEVSLTHVQDAIAFIPGIVVGSYWNKVAQVVHVGAQVTLPGTLGVGIGPAFVRTGDVHDIGVKADVYGLFGVMPHYSHVFRSEELQDFNEVGLYLKLPIPVHGRFSLSLGG